MKKKKQNGFTLIELIIAMGIFAIITGLVTINLLGAQHTASIDSTVTTLIADIKQQQIKAMAGDTEGRGATDQYGVHFDANKYVLFHGSYNAMDNANFVVNLEGSLNFTGSGDIIFLKGSGENSGLNAIVIKDSLTNRQKTININNYGVITSAN